MKQIRRLLMLLLLGMLVPVAPLLAADMAPDVLIKNVTEEVLQIIRSDPDIRAGDMQKIMQLAEEKVLPHFDFVHMVKLAMGRDGRAATPEQMKQLTAEFRTLLVRTYSKALTEYIDMEISFNPFKMKEGETDVRISSLIKKPGSEPIKLNYYLKKTDDGWKAYDIEIAGISLVTNYRGAFTREIRTNGIEGLIRNLQSKNQGNDSEAGKSQ